MFKEWKTLRGIAKCFGFSMDGMKILKRHEGFPACRVDRDGVKYNYYAFRDWLKKYEAGEVREIPPATVTPEELKMREESKGKYFMDGKWIKNGG